MIEDIEGLSSYSNDANKAEGLSDTMLEYLGECISPLRVDELIERIDEIQDKYPPSAIDSNPQIAELIAPIKDQIPVEYLEAPSDFEQVCEISDVMAGMEELRPEEWQNLSIEERVEVLNYLESQVAEIEHRPACPVEAEDLGFIFEMCGELQGNMGLHQSDFLGNERIVINTELLASNDPRFFREVLDTVIHEGRHSYQTYNLDHRETHTSQGDLTNWQVNRNDLGYQDAEKCGFRAYWMQPIEADARKFAEDVLTAYQKKV